MTEVTSLGGQEHQIVTSMASSSHSHQQNSPQSHDGSHVVVTTHNEMEGKKERDSPNSNGDS